MLRFCGPQDLAKAGREALEFKQKAESAAVDLQAGALERKEPYKEPKELWDILGSWEF